MPFYWTVCLIYWCYPKRNEVFPMLLLAVISILLYIPLAVLIGLVKKYY